MIRISCYVAIGSAQLMWRFLLMFKLTLHGHIHTDGHHLHCMHAVACRFDTLFISNRWQTDTQLTTDCISIWTVS